MTHPVERTIKLTSPRDFDGEHCEIVMPRHPMRVDGILFKGVVLQYARIGMASAPLSFPWPTSRLGQSISFVFTGKVAAGDELAEVLVTEFMDGDP